MSGQIIPVTTTGIATFSGFKVSEVALQNMTKTGPRISVAKMVDLLTSNLPALESEDCVGSLAGQTQSGPRWLTSWATE